MNIDLFTDAAYGSIDFVAIDEFLQNNFAYTSTTAAMSAGIGKSYLAGKDIDKAIKIDLYYTDNDITPTVVADKISMASLEDIIAMKIDIVQRRGRKKDFWDLHELMDHYSIDKMISLHKLRYSYGHDEAVIRQHFTDFSLADDDFDPICLKGKHWELIKLEIIQVLGKSK